MNYLLDIVHPCKHDASALAHARTNMLTIAVTKAFSMVLICLSNL